jgi:WD40 repeat protein
MSLQGGIITRRPLCLSSDGRLLLAACGAEVRVYSARTGDHISSLRGHFAEVTSIVEQPGSGSSSGGSTVRVLHPA